MDNCISVPHVSRFLFSLRSWSRGASVNNQSSKGSMNSALNSCHMTYKRLCPALMLLVDCAKILSSS